MSFPKSLRGFEERRIDEPRVVAKELRALFPQLPRSEQPVAMGIYASCLRQLDKTEACLVALDDALDLARRDGNVWAEANLLQRRSATESSRGKTDSAIGLSREALALFLECGDLDRVGTCLYDLSRSFFDSQDWHRAIRLSLSAMSYLTSSNLHYAFACHTCLAISYSEISDVKSSLASLEQARQAAYRLSTQAILARYRWTEASLMMKIGRFRRAQTLLRSTATEYLNSGQGLEAALAIVELARAILAQGKVAEALEVTRESRKCLLHLPEKSQAAAIIESAWRQTEVAAVNESFLAKVAKGLERCGAK